MSKCRPLQLKITCPGDVRESVRAHLHEVRFVLVQNDIVRVCDVK